MSAIYWTHIYMENEKSHVVYSRREACHKFHREMQVSGAYTYSRCILYTGKLIVQHMRLNVIVTWLYNLMHVPDVKSRNYSMNKPSTCLILPNALLLKRTRFSILISYFGSDAQNTHSFKVKMHWCILLFVNRIIILYIFLTSRNDIYYLNIFFFVFISILWIFCK